MAFNFNDCKRSMFDRDTDNHLTCRVDIPDGSPIVVKIIKDSITDNGSRLITWCWEYWRSIHEEVMTHRALSRNSASSRAIPAKRMRDWILERPAIPVYWGANQKGMQADQELSPTEREIARVWWLRGLDMMAEHHQRGEELGLHKQIVNRIIQPWMTMSVIVSATDHANLFHLRKHSMAEPHFQCLANLAWELFHNHMPRYLPPGQWHLPYVDEETASGGVTEALKLSVGRCARVSYLTHDGKRDPAEDIRLHDMLAKTASLGAEPMHASPFEHQAVAVGERQRLANFEGWKQYRRTFEHEAGPNTEDRCNMCGAWGGRHVSGCLDAPIDL